MGRRKGWVEITHLPILLLQTKINVNSSFSHFMGDLLNV